MRFLSVVFVLSTASAGYSADGIRLPVAPVPPPAPQPVPAAVSTLSGDQWYVVDSDIPVIVLASPEGVVRITEDAGPIKLRGKFVDGSGGIETRTYKGKQVITVEAAAKGRVELLIVPVGAKDAKEIVRVMLDVNGARPPPVDPVDPVVPVEPVKSFRVIFIHESGSTIPGNQTAIMYAKAVSDYLNAKTTKEGNWSGWRRFDKDAEAANETPAMKALWQAVKPQVTGVPCWAIEVNGKAEILPFPASVEEALSTLKKYAGDK